MAKAILLSLLLLQMCHKDEPAKVDSVKKCAVPSWLDDVTQSITRNGYKGEIIKYLYQNEEVYLIRGCLNICADYIDVVRDCEGKTICEFGGIVGKNTCPDFDKGATKIETVWKN
jgi:hypothetical protein